MSQQSQRSVKISHCSLLPKIKLSKLPVMFSVIKRVTDRFTRKPQLYEKVDVLRQNILPYYALRFVILYQQEQHGKDMSKRHQVTNCLSPVQFF